MSSHPVNRFVRSAWTLVLLQLVAAFAAVGVTAWAAFQVRPLFEQRKVLTADIAALSKQKEALAQEGARLGAENDRLAERLTRGRQEARVRAAEPVRRGINAYHAGDYAGAIAAYDEALALDPENAYVLDLKSYSQFRANDLESAITSVTAALAADPTYVFGYSELARYACAAGKFDLAVSTYARAQAQHKDAPSLFASLLRDDGQFARLCAPARDKLGAPASAAPSATPSP
jgi:tetratricopeptide (TPR) repeat protein